jgi:hypothetical protein
VIPSSVPVSERKGEEEGVFVCVPAPLLSLSGEEEGEEEVDELL